jgi:RNAse (barnase) inhibitor barstar
MVGWDTSCETVREKVLDCVQTLFETQHMRVEAVHTSLAKQLIEFQNSNPHDQFMVDMPLQLIQYQNFNPKNQWLCQMFMAIVHCLKEAKDAGHSDCFIAICLLLTEILKNKALRYNLRGHFSLNSNYTLHLFNVKALCLSPDEKIILNMFKKFVVACDKFRSILADCDFDHRPEFVNCVQIARRTMDSTYFLNMLSIWRKGIGIFSRIASPTYFL